MPHMPGREGARPDGDNSALRQLDVSDHGQLHHLLEREARRAHGPRRLTDAFGSTTVRGTTVRNVCATTALDNMYLNIVVSVPNSWPSP